jgi:acetoin utilization deacetylase AcuC-like enzyme
VTRNAYGGSCYLNNAAIAAERLRELGAKRVGVVDVDAHHGNGAQQIFWERDDVFTGSVHVDPRMGWFPHFLGGADERGGGLGHGANLNVPLPPGAGDRDWLAGVAEIAQAACNNGAESLVLALGVDAADADPESPLRVTHAGYRRAGAIIANHGLPCVVVQEGGYDLASIGGLVLATLEGLAEGSNEHA